MTAPRRLPTNIPPRGLDARQAAEYCGVSKNHLLRHGPAATRIGGRNVYDRKLLDMWLDRLGGIATRFDNENRLEAAAREGTRIAIRNGTSKG
jgi:hypothetical protein